jgi:hypothetical protein
VERWGWWLLWTFHQESNVRQHLRSIVGSLQDPQKEKDQHCGEYYLQVPLYLKGRNTEETSQPQDQLSAACPGSPQGSLWPDRDGPTAQKVKQATAPWVKRRWSFLRKHRSKFSEYLGFLEGKQMSWIMIRSWKLVPKGSVFTSFPVLLRFFMKPALPGFRAV